MLMLLRARRLETIGCIMVHHGMNHTKEAWETELDWRWSALGGFYICSQTLCAQKKCYCMVWSIHSIYKHHFLPALLLPLSVSLSLSLSTFIWGFRLFLNSIWMQLIYIYINLRFYDILRIWNSSESHFVRFRSDCGHVQLRCGGSTSTKGHAPKAPSHFRAEPKPLLLPWSCKVFQCNFPRSKTEFQSKFECTGKIRQYDCSFILWRSVENYAIACQQHSGQLEASDFIQPHGIPPACNQLTTPQLSKTSNAFWGEWLGPATKRGCSSCATISSSLKSKGKNANHQGTCRFDWNKYCIVYG